MSYLKTNSQETIILLKGLKPLQVEYEESHIKIRRRLRKGNG
jgi:hypothetical protein